MDRSKNKAKDMIVVPPQKDCPATRRRLVEEYQRSVIKSGREPPAYHTFSDRYGGTRGVPFATRHDISPKDQPSASRSVVSVQWCIDHADKLETEGRYAEAGNYLQVALEQLQCNGSHAFGAPKVRGVVPEGMTEQNHGSVASILSRLGKISMHQGDYGRALNFFMLSSRLDPLTSTAYVLRASCHERLGNYGEAYSEYKKYLLINESTMDVLAHTGQCALKAGYYEEAESYLRELLRLTKQSESSPIPPSSRYANVESPSFYMSHAYYCLGLLRERQASDTSQRSVSSPEGEGSHRTAVEECTRQAHEFYALAASNTRYVAAFEEAAESAIAAGNVPLALDNLHILQHLCTDCAKYHFRAADVCALVNDTQSELEELSEALDRRQTTSERQQTLLRRASVYASKLRNLNNAILDLSLVLSMQGENSCVAMAYLQRANAFCQRSEQKPSKFNEDKAAALSDYEKFVETALASSQDLSIPPESITEAMLILADGAFKEKKYSVAATFFSRAVARGWKPRELLPRSGAGRRSTLQSSVVSYASITETDLLTKMYISLAHNIIEKHPVGEDMFKVPYEAREKSTLIVVGEPKKAKAADKREVEKPTVPVPVVGYQMADARYQLLRSLEPTVFSALQYEFLELWEPYRTEVEKLREDLTLARSGKKVKRR
uniref:Uncharacterized protein TCIL3000_10_12450 n=1 Tax=Trypanosoma congolense (strain IL3000) TaxID=1068625 RepID=G0UYJ6_TRYCI|nr:unnamed protein product [Trypanosoma congolense IL3000]